MGKQTSDHEEQQENQPLLPEMQPTSVEGLAASTESTALGVSPPAPPDALVVHHRPASGQAHCSPAAHCFPLLLQPFPGGQHGFSSL